MAHDDLYEAVRKTLAARGLPVRRKNASQAHEGGDPELVLKPSDDGTAITITAEQRFGPVPFAAENALLSKAHTALWAKSAFSIQADASSMTVQAL